MDKPTLVKPTEPSEDAPTNEPNETGARPPEQPDDQHDAKKSHVVTWLVLLFAVLLFAVGGTAYYMWKNNDDKDKKQSSSNTPGEDRAQNGKDTPPEDIKCDEGWTSYQDQSFGFGFCYPEAWGKAMVTDDKFEPADKGSRWLISFPEKDAVKVAFVSDDWSTTVPRDGTCATPVQDVDYSEFSPAWQTQGGTDITYAERDISAKAKAYSIEEHVDNLLTNGACIRGYVTLNTEDYTHITTSYFAEFSGGITTPKQHIDSPNTLVSVADREDITELVLSMKEYGN